MPLRGSSQFNNTAKKMTASRWLMEWTNVVLARANLRLDSRTGERIEESRLDGVSAAGGFGEPVYPLPEGFQTSRHQEILDSLPDYEQRFQTFLNAGENDVGFAYGNQFFEPVDAEVLYTVVRTKKPSRITEIGCGNSTRIIRQAILDGELNVEHRCIDPFPRVEIAELADEVRREKVESISPNEIAGVLDEGDLLFIDTSHEVLPANDVAYIYGRLLPLLGSGVFVHIHDVFTPYEYPESFARREDGKWGEQYLVQVMLERQDRWQVWWPGYYLQRSMADFEQHFPRMGDCLAQSIWLETK
jgi:hypothetical protein